MTSRTDPPEAAAGAAVPLRLALLAVAATLFLATLGQTVVSPALPVIMAELGGLDHITWVITAYLLASTIGAPVFGKLGDLFGRRAALQAGILVFLAGAVVAGLAPSLPVLVAGRALQGFGGGGLIVVAMAAVADLLPPRERGRAQGLLGAVFGVSTVIGPLLGGFLVEHLSWSWIFLVNLPVGLAALVVLMRLLPPGAPRGRPRIDLAGAGLLALLLSGAVVAGNLGGTVLPWLSPAMAGLAGLLLAALLAFAAVERRAAEPILPPALFRINAFLVSNTTGFLVGVAMFGTITFVPLFLQAVKGASPTVSGLFLLPMMAGIIAAAQGAGRVMARTGRYRMLPVAGTLLLAAALLRLSRVGPETALWQIGLLLLLVGLGIGPVLSIGVAAIQNAVPRAMLGVGTASANMFRLIGGSIGTAVFGAVFAAGLARNLAGLLPAGEGTGPGAFGPAALQALPEAARRAATEGFAQALSPVFLIAALCALLAAAVSLLLREEAADSPAG